MEENLQMEQRMPVEGIPQVDCPPSMATTPDGSAVSAVSSATAQASRQLKTSLIATFALLLVTITVFVAQTFAYFTDSSNSQYNQIVPGSLDASIIEVSENGNLNVSAQPVKIMPASVYTYGNVGVENTGSLSFYVRIKIVKTILSSEHEMSPGWEDLIACNFMASESDQDLWVYHEGYYYYKHALAPGEKTAALFDKVLFSPQMGNEFKNSSIQFKIICQSVQSGGNSDNPVSAWGWPVDANGTN